MDVNTGDLVVAGDILAPEPCRWAVVELMGHRTRAGAIMWHKRGDTEFLVVEHPTRADHTGEEPLTEMYGASAIYCLRVCSRDEAVEVAGRVWAEKSADVEEPF